MEAVSSMDALVDAAMLEVMAISDDEQLGTAGGEPAVDLADSDLMKAAVDVSAVDKENEGAQRAGADHRSAALGAALFGMPPLNASSEADTHSLSGDTHPGAAAAASAASPLTATSVGERANVLLPGSTSVPAVKPRQPPVVVMPTYHLADLAFAAAGSVPLIRSHFLPHRGSS